MKTKVNLIALIISLLAASCLPDFDIGDNWGDTGCLGCGLNTSSNIVPDLYVAGTYQITSISESIRQMTNNFEGHIDSVPYNFESYPISFNTLELLKDSSFIIVPEEDDEDFLYGHYKHGADFYLNNNKITGDKIVLFFANPTFNDTLIISHNNYDIYSFTQHSAIYVKDGTIVSTSKGFFNYYWNIQDFDTQLYDKVFAQNITYTIERYQ